MNAIEFDRNRPLREALQPAAGCPPLAELVDALFTGAKTPAAEALRAHAAGCFACAAELELARAFDDSPRDAAEAQEIARVAGGFKVLSLVPAAAESPIAPPPQMARVLKMERPRLRGKSETPLWTRWAAAAMVVVGLGFMFEWAHRTIGGAPRLPDAPASDVVRSGELLLDSPIGTLHATPAQFSWRAVAGAGSYRVELRDVAGDLVWQGLSPATTLSAPPELTAKLESFVTYRWNVTALDASASAVAHSAPTSFRIEPSPN